MPVRTQKTGKDAVDKSGILSLMKDFRQQFKPRVDFDQPGNKTFALKVGRDQRQVTISVWFANGAFRANVDLPMWAADAAPTKGEGDASKLAIFKNKGSVAVRLNIADRDRFREELKNLISGILRNSAGSSMSVESCLGVHILETATGNVAMEKFDFWGNGKGKYAYVVTSPKVVEAVGPIPRKVTDLLVDESWQILGHVNANSRKEALSKIESILSKRMTDNCRLVEKFGSLQVLTEQVQGDNVKKNGRGKNLSKKIV